MEPSAGADGEEAAQALRLLVALASMEPSAGADGEGLSKPLCHKVF